MNTQRFLASLPPWIPQIPSPRIVDGLFSCSIVGATILTVTGLVATGCDKPTGRMEVSGAVSFKGTELKSGSIHLTLMEGEKQFSSGAMIRDGKYHIPREKGLWPGKYHVVISAPDLDAPEVIVRDSSGRRAPPAPPELIPPEYNINSQKTIEVTIDGENRFVFDIMNDAA
jgi:hypothetical protein